DWTGIRYQEITTSAPVPSCRGLAASAFSSFARPFGPMIDCTSRTPPTRLILQTNNSGLGYGVVREAVQRNAAWAYGFLSQRGVSPTWRGSGPLHPDASRVFSRAS